MDTTLPRLHAILTQGLDTTKVGVTLAQPVEQTVHDPTGPSSDEQRHVVLEHDISYNWLHWESEVYPKPTQEEFDAALAKARRYDYQDSRRDAYPSVEDQLDMLYHDGYEGWRATIDAVKQQYPKPE